jgi:hypothetical protein
VVVAVILVITQEKNYNHYLFAANRGNVAGNKLSSVSWNPHLNLGETNGIIFIENENSGGFQDGG